MINDPDYSPDSCASDIIYDVKDVSLPWDADPQLTSGAIAYHPAGKGRPTCTT
jgi:hypothetical protein